VWPLQPDDVLTQGVRDRRVCDEGHRELPASSSCWPRDGADGAR
jgi:hypothetical protein